MRIEFRTVHNVFDNEKMGQIYAKYFMEKQNKQYKNMNIISVVIALIAFGTGIGLENSVMAFSGILYAALIWVMTNYAKKKAIPKSFCRINNIGCPYNVTFGLYDEYFYEKYENNMSISENSIRYEFLKKIVETPEYFVLMTKRTQIFFLPKSDMGYENVLEFSAFCKSRLPYLYSIKG